MHTVRGRKAQNHFASRRNFLKGAAATGVAAAGSQPIRAASCRGAANDDPPQDTGGPAGATSFAAAP